MSRMDASRRVDVNDGRLGRLVALLAALLMCSTPGCGDGPTKAATDTDATDTDGRCAEPLSPPAVSSARLEIDEDGRLRDALGRVVVMRGINTGGRSKWSPFVPFPIAEDASLEQVRAAAETYFDRLAPWGLDTVRMPFSWEALEPARGALDGRYLDRYEVMVDVAWARGLRVIVDFHQDVYASPYCGDGFPLWTLAESDPGPPRHDCPEWFLGYAIDDGVQQAFDRLWADEDDVQLRMREMWATVAERFAAHPGVVGFELINEPGWGSESDVQGWKRDVLAPFYERLAAEVLAIAPDVLVLYDNPGIDALGYGQIQHIRPAGPGMVYAPHLYDIGLINSEPWTGDDPGELLDAFANFSLEQRTPVLVGEFGIGDGAEGGPEWLTMAMDAIDEHLLSATLWEYSVSDELWNEEDLSVVSATGQERAVLDTYVRPWLRALAGRDARFSWDAAAGRGQATWIADEGTSEIVVTTRRFEQGFNALELRGEGACYTADHERGLLMVRAPAGTEVTITFEE